MIDKGLYTNRKNFRVAGAAGREYDSPSAPAAETRSDPFSGGGGGGSEQYSATQTQTGAVKGGGMKMPGGGYGTGFVSGDDGRRSRDNFIANVQRTNPGYTGRPTRNVPTLGEFFSGIFRSLPGLNFLRNLNQRIQNTDFARSKNLMDYLDIKQYGGFDEREMARRINRDEAKLLQARIDAGEFGGLDTMLDEVALTGGNTIGDGVMSVASSDIAPQFQDLVTLAGINETQQKMIDSAANMYGKINPGEKLDATTQQEIFDSVKKFDTKAKDKTLGLFGGQEADPMTEQEYKDYLISQGFI